MLTGQSPTDIESSWDEGDVNWTLFVYRAQVEARLTLAKQRKADYGSVPVPMSVLVDANDEDFYDEELVFDVKREQ